MIADALLSNSDLKLTHFHAGRDRLENKGITALAKVFEQMGSLQEIHVPQNGIKDSGMKELIKSLTKCKDLHTIRVNDNWLKSEATEQLFGLLLTCVKLRELNISDGNMGTANVLAALRALKLSANKELKHFSCNYNDVESRKAATEILEVLIQMEGIVSVDFIGNVPSKKFNKEWLAKFTEAEK
jgi:Ran GTPase-activating protein 1